MASVSLAPPKAAGKAHVLKSNVVNPKEFEFIRKVYDAAGINGEPFNKAAFGKAALSTIELKKLQDKGILKYTTNSLKGPKSHTTVVLLVEPERLQAKARGRAASGAGNARATKPTFAELRDFVTVFAKYVDMVDEADLRTDPARSSEARELQAQIAVVATSGDVTKLQRMVHDLSQLHKKLGRAQAVRSRVQVAAERMVRDDAARWGSLLRLLGDVKLP